MTTKGEWLDRPVRSAVTQSPRLELWTELEQLCLQLGRKDHEETLTIEQLYERIAMLQSLAKNHARSTL